MEGNCTTCQLGRWVSNGCVEIFECPKYPCWPRPKKIALKCDSCNKAAKKWMFMCGEATSFHCDSCYRLLIKSTEQCDMHRWKRSI